MEVRWGRDGNEGGAGGELDGALVGLDLLRAPHRLPQNPFSVTGISLLFLSFVVWEVIAGSRGRAGRSRGDPGG